MNKKTLKIVLAAAALLVLGVACWLIFGNKGGQPRRTAAAPTEAPAVTTEAPATEAPGTEAPVTEAPATEIPTEPAEAVDGHITITVKDENGKVLADKEVGFKAGQTVADLLEANFENVTIDNGFLMTLESLTTPADYHTYIAFYVNGEYAMQGVTTQPFTDGDKIEFVNTVYIPEDTTAEPDVFDGHVTITVKDENDSVLAEKEVGFMAGQTVADLLEANFENVTIDNGFLMTLESLTTPADYHTYIAFFVNGEYAMQGVTTQPFADGDKIEFINTVYLPETVPADEFDGHVTITVKDEKDNVLAEKEVGFMAGQTVADLLEANFENVTIDNGFLMTLESLTTPADYHTYIAFYINGEYASEGVTTQPFADGDRIEFINTVYIAP